MKKILRQKQFYCLILLLTLFFLGGCQKEVKKNQSFSVETAKQIKEKAKSYPNEDYQNGDVPLHEFVTMTGKITKSDGTSKEVKKGDRFVLQVGAFNYQILNQQDTIFYLDDEVTVFGEYYGFITASYIEKNEGGEDA